MDTTWHTAIKLNTWDTIDILFHVRAQIKLDFMDSGFVYGGTSLHFTPRRIFFRVALDR